MCRWYFDTTVFNAAIIQGHLTYMAANYNNSAWFYDGLSRIVYGKSLINAQVYLLSFVPKNANVLIVGGGTGWILEELTYLHSSGLTITYVEIAADMMALSQKRYIGDNQVIFVNDAIENSNITLGYEVVITPFLLDNFTEATLNKVFKNIDILLKPSALWLNASFQLTGKWWQQVLLKSMFIFFKLICNIEASKLPEIDSCFEGNSYQIFEQKSFYGDFVGAKVWKK